MTIENLAFFGSTNLFLFNPPPFNKSSYCNWGTDKCYLTINVEREGTFFAACDKNQCIAKYRQKSMHFFLVIVVLPYPPVYQACELPGYFQHCTNSNF